MDFLVTPQTSNSLIDCYSCSPNCGCYGCNGTKCDCNSYCVCKDKIGCTVDAGACPSKYCTNKTCTIKADISSIP